MALICFVVILCGEIIVRVFPAEGHRKRVKELQLRKVEAEKLLQEPPDLSLQRFYRLHPYYGFAGRPRMREMMWGWELETDPHGFRNRSDFDFLKVPESEVVIGLFGGSAAFGYGIDGNAGTVAPQLEALMNNGSFSRKFHVVNFAQQTWHQPQQFFLLSRIIERLDGIILLDGYNEIAVPLNNTVKKGTPFPPDFPRDLILEPMLIRHNAEMSMAFLDLLRYENGYTTHSLLAKSALYNLFRHRRYTALKSAVLKKQLSPDKAKVLAALSGERHFDPAAAPAGLLEYGAEEQAKYARMTDLVARQYGVPILHATQPFRFANPQTPFIKSRGYEFPEDKHPSFYYDPVRRKMAELYGSGAPGKGVWYLDLSESLPPGDEYWLDFVHATPKGWGVVAGKLCDQLTTSGFLRELDTSPTPRSRNHRRVEPSREYEKP